MEQQWLQAKREKAAKVFNDLPLPAHEEYWRRIPLSRIPFGNFAQAKIAATEAMPPLSEEARSKGVKWLPLEKACSTFPEIVEKYLGKSFQNNPEKFIAQNEAFWNQGFFCHIPKNVHLKEPLILLVDDKEEKNLCTRLLVVVGAHAKATVFHQTHSKENATENFVNSLTEIYLEEGAKLDWIEIQDRSQKTYEIARRQMELERSAEANIVLAVQGGLLSKTDWETNLKGEGSHAQIVGLILADQKQQLEVFTNTRHLAPHTTADILFKAVAKDRAKTIFQGMIYIAKKAQQTVSYMANNNLILSENAHADSLPRLEIEADDVKASHGATIGQVDPEQLFYLRSKGLPKEAAEKLLVEGFVEEVLGCISSKVVQELFRREVL